MLQSLAAGDRSGKIIRESTNDAQQKSYANRPFHRKRVETPNDLKLSDSGVRRGTCMVGGKAAAEAGAVTHGAVRCSAWLGVAVIWELSGVVIDKCEESLQLLAAVNGLAILATLREWASWRKVSLSKQITDEA